MKSQLKMLLTASVAASAIAISAPSALSQTTDGDAAESDRTLGAITVTARRSEESLQDVPGTVSVVTQETIERAGVERAEDFLALTPGVTIVDAAEVGDTQVNIRGINGARDAENSFAFILDGILITNPAGFNREFTDLQQIEVFKGPQGAIYGRNAAAGAIIATTETPGDDYEASFKASAAEFGSYFASGSVGGPLVENVLSGRVSADYRTTDGFYENDFLGRDDIVDNFEAYNLNGRLVYTPSDNTTIDLKARYGEVEAGSIVFNAVFAAQQLEGILGIPELFEDVNDHDFRFQSNVESSNDQESLELSGKIEHDFDFGTLTAWALYTDIEQDLLADGTSASFGFFFTEPNCVASVANLFGAGVTLPSPQFLAPDPASSVFGPYTPTTCDGYQYQVRNQSDFSAEVRFASNSDGPLSWSVGAYFLDLEREVGVATGIDTGGPIIPALFNDQTTTSPTEQLVYDRFDSTVYAIFGQTAYDVTDDLELSLALRYDVEERDVENLVPVGPTTQFIDFTNDGMFSGGAPLNPGLDPTINPGGVIEPQSETFEELQPKLSITYDVLDNVTLFGSWGVGFKSGGFNNQGASATIDLFINQALGTNVQIDDMFREETSSAFEAGFKANFLDGRISTEGAVFYTDVEDMQFFEFFVGPFGLLRVVSNIDEVTLQGVEFAGSAEVNDYVSIFGGVSVVDSEIEANASRPNTVGNKSPYTPDYTFNAGAQFQYPVTESMDLVARVDWNRVGETFFHTVQDQDNPSLFLTANYGLAERDAYDLVNLRLGVEGDGWALTAFADNLFDQDYVEEVIPAPEFGGSFVAPGTLQLIGVELALEY